MACHVYCPPHLQDYSHSTCVNLSHTCFLVSNMNVPCGALQALMSPLLRVLCGPKCGTNYKVYMRKSYSLRTVQKADYTNRFLRLSAAEEVMLLLEEPTRILLNLHRLSHVEFHSKRPAVICRLAIKSVQSFSQAKFIYVIAHILAPLPIAKVNKQI